MKYANNAKLPYLCSTTQATQDIKREKPNEWAESLPQSLSFMNNPERNRTNNLKSEKPNCQN